MRPMYGSKRGSLLRLPCFVFALFLLLSLLTACQKNPAGETTPTGYPSGEISRPQGSIRRPPLSLSGRGLSRTSPGSLYLCRRDFQSRQLKPAGTGLPRKPGGGRSKAVCRSGGLRFHLCGVFGWVRQVCGGGMNRIYVMDNGAFRLFRRPYPFLLTSSVSALHPVGLA